MTTKQQTARPGPEKPTAKHDVRTLIRESWRALAGWMGLISASLIGFLLTEGARYHHLAVGVLLTSATLFILMVLFEVAWRLLIDDDA